MTKVVISFDTEDYVNPLGADGILRTAQVLQSLGVRGCYNIVAWLAQALVKWERTDVLEALKYHETETHSLRHSTTPPSANTRISRILTKHCANSVKTRMRHLPSYKTFSETMHSMLLVPPEILFPTWQDTGMPIWEFPFTTAIFCMMQNTADRFPAPTFSVWNIISAWTAS